MTTTTDIMALAEEYAEAECQATRRSHVDPSIERDALRTAVERLVAERDALRKALALTSMDCEHLHHAPKDRHTMTEPCPVVARVNAALEGKP